MNNRGYFGIGIYNIKTEHNVGTLWRSAYAFGASFIYTIGRRYKKQHSDTSKTINHIPLYHYESFEEFYKNLPYNCFLIGIEQTKNSIDTKRFSHPERTIYLLGAEDYGLPENIINKCHKIVHINTPICLNVAVAGSIIMHDRRNKNERL